MTTTEIVYSPVEDKKINSDISNSKIWKDAYKEEEFTEELRKARSLQWYGYTIKFNDVTPMQCTKIDIL